MNEQETKDILALCSEIWAKVPPPSASRLAIWQEMLADSEIRHTVAEMTGPVYPTPAEAYGQIHQAVNRADWDETEIKEHVHPLFWRVYQWIGAYDYRMASSDIIRAQFMRMYQTELTRAMEHDRIPEAFHRQTEARAAGGFAGDAHAALPDPEKTL